MLWYTYRHMSDDQKSKFLLICTKGNCLSSCLCTRKMLMVLLAELRPTLGSEPSPTKHPVCRSSQGNHRICRKSLCWRILMWQNCQSRHGFDCYLSRWQRDRLGHHLVCLCAVANHNFIEAAVGVFRMPLMPMPTVQHHYLV